MNANQLFSCATVDRTAASELIDVVEWTADTVWISRTQECRRATLRGVPGRRVDVIVDARIVENRVDQRDVITVEVIAKCGRYDGAQRPRIHIGIREGRHDRRDPAPPCAVTVQTSSTNITIRLAVGGDGWSGAEWSGVWERLRSDLNDYNPARVVMWHWRRYYQMIPDTDAVALADAWAAEMSERVAPPTLAEANREASRMLYRAARNAGWRKLTLREQSRLGLARQWVPDQEYAVAQSAYYGRHRTDLSDATVAFASGIPSAAARYMHDDLD